MNADADLLFAVALVECIDEKKYEKGGHQAGKVWVVPCDEDIAVRFLFVGLRQNGVSVNLESQEIDAAAHFARIAQEAERHALEINRVCCKLLKNNF